MTDDTTRPTSARATATQRPFRLLNWLLVGGAVVVLIPSAAIFIWAWSTGETFNLATLGGQKPAPLSRGAAFDALICTYLFALFVGLPLLALWSLVCIVVAWVKRANGRR
jgi:hypothetical protein